MSFLKVIFDMSNGFTSDNYYVKNLPVLFALVFTGFSGCGDFSEHFSKEAHALETSWERERREMVRRQIHLRGVKNSCVLETMKSVPRHLFVPQNLIAQAYADYPLPIGAGQTISQPYIVAFMTELLEVETRHSVLEIGTGSGYQAAVLSRLADKVYSIEIVKSLGVEARRRLDQLGYRNVRILIGDGHLGWPEYAPFDRIILTAAAEEVPKRLLDQLATPGRLVAPIGRPNWSQDLIVIDKDTDGKIKRRKLLPVRFVPMTGKPK